MEQPQWMVGGPSPPSVPAATQRTRDLPREFVRHTAFRPSATPPFDILGVMLVIDGSADRPVRLTMGAWFGRLSVVMGEKAVVSVASSFIASFSDAKTWFSRCAADTTFTRCCLPSLPALPARLKRAASSTAGLLCLYYSAPLDAGGRYPLPGHIPYYSPFTPLWCGAEWWV